MSHYDANQPRKPIGLKGGEWTVGELAENGVGLLRPGFTAREAADRYDQMIRAGYVSAVPIRGQDPKTTDGILGWWDAHRLANEMRASGEGIRQMPDDFTASKRAANAKSGNSLDGNRLVSRMKYVGQDLTLRMPAVKAVKLFAAHDDGSPCDIPVGCSFNDVDGNPVVIDPAFGKSPGGIVRVEKSNGYWSAVALGFPAGVGEGVAEGVAAMLEARKPSLGFRHVGSVLQNFKAREAAKGAPMQAVSSSFVSAFGRDAASGVVAMQTKTGATFGYLTISDETFQSVVSAASPGSMYNKLIKGSPRVPVSRCENCGRFYGAAGRHTCPMRMTPDVGVVHNAGAQEYAMAVLGANARAVHAQDTAVAEAAVPRGASDSHAQYYTDNDAKHFGTGSTFTDPALARTEDVVALAIAQRGTLAGDDRDELIAAGADPDAFADGHRYLKVATPGTVGVIGSRELAGTDLLQVVRDKAGAPCTLVVTVAKQPTTDTGVVIVTTDRSTGADLVLTTFPGPVTRPTASDALDRLEGSSISVAEARTILGRDFHANTRVQVGAHTPVAGAKTIDMKVKMAAQFAGRDGKTGYFGKPGWTLDTVTDQVAPFTSSAHVPERYSEYSWNGETRRSANGDNGLVYFSGMGASGSAAILSTLTRKQASGTQNDSPTLGTMLQAAVDHPGKVEVHGYVASPGRQDERLTVEGIFIYDDTLKTEADVKRAARATYGLSSGQFPPDEITQEENPSRPGEKAWRLWWD